eukprot:7756581-Pyramimonas_sp.AAC.1
MKRCTGCGDACELRLWDLRWSSLWGHEALYWVGETHANCASGTFGGAPWAMKLFTGWARRIRIAPLGPS